MDRPRTLRSPGGGPPWMTPLSPPPHPQSIHYQIQSILPPKYFLNLGLLSKSTAHTLAKVTTIPHLRHGKKLCITLPLVSSPPVLQLILYNTKCYFTPYNPLRLTSIFEDKGLNPAMIYKYDVD